MIIPEVLQKPLVFGNDEQIRALRLLEERAEYDALAKCTTCDGTGEVPVECEACSGEGIDATALEAHRNK